MPSQHVVLLMSLAACEQAELAARPQAPEPPRETVIDAKPAPAVAAPVPEPAPAERTQLYFGSQRGLDGELDRRCMSRAGCRWQGERTTPRVVKKP